jgi:DNA-binding NtrC family response regulator
MKKNSKILLVCDDEALRGAYLKSLAYISRDVEFVGDADGALAAVKLQSFDLVLLDLRSSATVILRSIKQNSPASEVVVLTSDPHLAGAKEAVRLGAYDYVAKPVGPDEVLNLSDAALRHKGWALHAEQRL